MWWHGKIRGNIPNCRQRCAWQRGGGESDVTRVQIEANNQSFEIREKVESEEMNNLPSNAFCQLNCKAGMKTVDSDDAGRLVCILKRKQSIFNVD